MSCVMPPGMARRARSKSAAAFGWRARYVSMIVMLGMIAARAPAISTKQERLIRSQRRAHSWPGEADVRAVQQDAAARRRQWPALAAEIGDEGHRGTARLRSLERQHVAALVEPRSGAILVPRAERRMLAAQRE